MGFEHCYSHDCDLTSIFVANAGLWCWEASSVLLLVGRDAARGDWPVVRGCVWYTCGSCGCWVVGNVTRNRNRDRSVKGPHKVTVHTGSDLRRAS